MVQRITISAEQYHSQHSDVWIALTADQIHYLTRVLRLKTGEQFIALNGEGRQWLAAVGQLPEKAPVLQEVAAAESVVPPLRLVAALPKGNSFDQVVRQATELGVTHICPVMSDRTLLKPSGNKLTRWRRIAEEAAEQSERLTVPNIFQPISFQQCVEHPPWEEGANNNSEISFLEENSNNISKQTTELRYLCAARVEKNKKVLLLADLLAQQPASRSSELIPGVTLAIGPEGGWTSDEITVAVKSGYKVVSLGSVILRAVTAPLTALSLVRGARDLLM